MARGDGDRFALRLALDGLDAETAVSVLGEASWTGPLPDWAEFVSEGLAHMTDPDLDGDRCLPGCEDDPVPLQELTVPFVRAARERIEARFEPPASAVGPSVLPALERQLLAQLGSLASAVADLEFRLWRRNRSDPLEEAVIRAGDDPGRGLYDAWIARARSGGLTALLSEYAFLARQLGRLALGWVDATAEFLECAVGDAEALAREFHEGRPLGRLIEVGGAFSDPHRGRRRVVGCTFESGRRLVYKPKNLRSEVVYGRLLEWLNAHGTEMRLRSLRVLELGDHGWVELAEQRGVPDEAAARRYYRRAGMLLALLYAVGGKDCHAENVVAAGEDPVVVDAETVLHPTLLAPDAPIGEEADAPHAAVALYSASVLGVGLLPDWMIGSDGRAFDISGLGGIEAQEGLEPVTRWDHPNSDVARLVLDRGVVEPSANVLQLAGRTQQPEAYVDELCEGFVHAYRILLRGRGELLGPDGPPAALEDAPVRVLFRATNIYARVANAAQQPQHLKEGADHSIELELLGRPLLDSPSPEAFWELHRGEQAQLAATDIPYFSALGGSEALCADDGRPLLRFQASALETARQRLAALSGADERTQTALIRAAIGTRLPLRARARASSGDSGGAHRDGAALEAAVALGRELDEAAIRTGGSVAWVGLSLRDEAERWTLRPTAQDLYEGATGVAVFLAGLARVTGEDSWRRLSLAALAPVIEESKRHPGRLAVLRGIGGSTGFGGMVYGLALVAELLRDQQPLEAARALARALPASALASDEVFDLLGGAAGALAGLLALDRVAEGDAQALELAEGAASVLARGAVETEDGSIMWRTAANRTLDGFSHGTSGIALQLARFAARVGDSALLPLVRRAVEGESRRFDPALGGWPDRRNHHWGTMRGWCHGPAGIGLARFGLRALPFAAELEPFLTRDLQRAKDLVSSGPLPLDHLCCGGAGEAEFLRDLAADDPGAGRLANERCDELAERIVAGESPRLMGPEPGNRGELPSPSLFQGTSGVGLALVRRVAPDLPSVLAWR